MKKNKYQQTIDEVLDLHGLTAQEAEQAIIEFFAKMHLAGKQRVRLITGKGINSPDGKPVLKPMVERWLREKGYDFRPAKISEGGEGALEVRLDL